MCPLCGQRKARRACPALGKPICAVCCGTKRLVEIQCPSDCAYLTTARDHPAAVVVRQQQRDLTDLVQHMRDLNERQSQLFFLVNRFLVSYQPAELHPLIDEDVAAAAGALAATLETSARGVIYEHHAPSLAAERLSAALKPLLKEVGGSGGSAFERDAAVVLRRIEAAAHADASAGRRAYLDRLKRVIKAPAESAGGGPAGDESAEPGRSRLIVP